MAGGQVTAMKAGGPMDSNLPRSDETEVAVLQVGTASVSAAPETIAVTPVVTAHGILLPRRTFGISAKDFLGDLTHVITLNGGTYGLRNGEDNAAEGSTLNRGDSLTFSADSGGAIATLAFTIMTAADVGSRPGSQVTLALDVDGDVVGMGPRGPADDLLATMAGLSNGDRIVLDFQAREARVNGRLVTLADAFWQAADLDGVSRVTLGARFAEGPGFALSDVAMTAAGGPRAVADLAAIADGDPAIAGDVLVNDLDNDGDGQALTVVAINGLSANVGEEIVGAFGFLTVRADGTFDYRLNSASAQLQSLDDGETGEDQFAYTVIDGNGLRSTAQVKISVAGRNDAPTAANSSYSATEDSTLVVSGSGVLASAQDIDGDALTAVLVAGPLHGTLNLLANGRFTYTPDADFNGQDSFSWRASDGSASSGLATVTLTVSALNDAPVATGTTYALEENGELSVNDLLAGASDVDGDTLAAELISGPSHGELVFNADGSFVYTPDDGFSGSDSFQWRATDGSLGSTPVTVALTVEASGEEQPPALLSFGLSRSSDTGAVGDGATTATIVNLVGATEPGTVVTLPGGLQALADINGVFQFTGVTLALGENDFELTLTGTNGLSRTVEQSVIRDPAEAAAPDPVLTWNRIALETVRLDAASPNEASRALAIESVAVLDVLNALDGAPSILVRLAPPANVDTAAAIAVAAHRVLTTMFPAQTARLDAALASSLSGLADGPAKAGALSFGVAVANAVLAIREDDGWNDFALDETGSGPGVWVPTGPMYSPGADQQWADATPFIIAGDDSFRPGPPPALTSAEYAAAYDQVRRLGAADSTERTAEQTQIARFWADGMGTYTPPGHWNQIAAAIAEAAGGSSAANARALAMLNLAMADAGIATWDAKYFYDLWRPVTAINHGDEDGNAGTVDDDDWSSFLITPNFPGYVSGHSSFSGAAARILTGLFGDVAFTASSVGLPGVVRSFTSFTQAASEAAISRIYGGIHFSFESSTGLAMGDAIAAAVQAFFATGTDTRAPRVIVDQDSGAVFAAAPAITGYALDNLSGVEHLRARVGNGPLAEVTIDAATGRFRFDDALGATHGPVSITFEASDAAGNAMAPVRIDFIVDALDPIVSLASLADGLLADGVRLTGSVDGTGSAITALSWSLDGGLANPLSFNAATGAFDAPLPLGDLAPGQHLLRISATDAAGHVRVLERSLVQEDAAAFALVRTTPVDGAGEVGVTFRPQVVFSRAVDIATLTSDSLYLTDASGQPIAARIVPAADGRSARLFVEGAMPGGSTMRLHVDGQLIRAASDGARLDADADGTAGGLLEAAFSTVSTTGVPGTTLSGFIVGPGADLAPMTFDDIRAGPDQTLHTADDVFLERLAGVKVYVIGFEDRAVYTDARGRFLLTDVPVGNAKIVIDGRTATNPPDGVFYPEMVMDVRIRPGVNNTMMGTMGSSEDQLANLDRGEVYLPRLSTSILTLLDDDADTVVTMPSVAAADLTEQERGRVSLVVAPGSVLDEHGQPVDGAMVGISTVPVELVRDMLPPGLLQHTFDITIQVPGGAVFDTPAQLTLPNIFGAPPGTKLNLLSFDHTTGRLVITGTATVSADGLSVTTDPGSGVSAPGWHGLTPPGVSSAGNANAPPPCFADDAHAIVGDITHSAASEPLVCAQTEPGRMDGDGLPPDLDFKPAVDPSKLSPNIHAILDDIVAAWNKIGGRNALVNDGFSNSANGQSRNSGSKHNTGDAIDLGTRTGSGYISPEDINEFVRRLTGKDLQPAPTPGDSERRAVRWGDYDVIHERPGVSGRDHIHIEYDPQPSGFSEDANKAPSTDLKLASYFSDASDLLAAWSFDVPTAPLGGAYFLVYNQLGAPVFRGKTDARGNFDVFLPEYFTGYTVVWDPVTGLVKRGSVATGASGSALDLFDPSTQNWENVVVGQLAQYSPQQLSLLSASEYDALLYTEADQGAPLWYLPILIDSDGDLLSDEVEFVLGTDASSADSDGDGLTDLFEIQNDLDPLGGFPTATGIASIVDTVGEARAIEVVRAADGRQMAYVADGNGGLAIVDVTSPLAPVLKAQFALPGYAIDIAVDAGLARAAVALRSGVAIVDIADPAAPVLVETLSLASDNVEIMDGLLIAGVGGALRVLDLATLEDLTTQTFPGAPAAILDIGHDGDTLVVLDSEAVLHVLTFDGDLFETRGALQLSFAGDNGQIFVADGRVYIGGDTGFNGGYSTVDISDPEAPALISSVDDPSLAGGAIALNGSGLGLLAGNPGGAFGANALDVVRTGDPTDTADFVTRVTLPSTPYDVAIGSGLAFVAAGDRGLVVVNYLAYDTGGVAPTIDWTRRPADIDPLTAGVQVQEGQLIRLGALLQDDVQVRDVQLIVDGVVATTDGAYPWDLSFRLPTLASDADGVVTIQLRASDTGGNFALSSALVLRLSPDIVAPTLISSSIEAGDNVAQSGTVLRLAFSEAIDIASVSLDDISLVSSDGEVRHPTAMFWRNGDRSVRLTLPNLDIGDWTLVIDNQGFHDLAGNPIAPLAPIPFEVNEFTSIWIADGFGHWSNGANWSEGAPPDEDDVVLIDRPDGPEPGQYIYIGRDEVVGSLTSRLWLALDVPEDADGHHSLTVLGAADFTRVSVGFFGVLALEGESRAEHIALQFEGILTGGGDLTITQFLEVHFSSKVTGGGALTIADGAVLSLSRSGGDDSYLGRDVVLEAGARGFSNGMTYLSWYDGTNSLGHVGSLTIETGAVLSLSYSDLASNWTPPAGVDGPRIVNHGQIWVGDVLNQFHSGVFLESDGEISLNGNLTIHNALLGGTLSFNGATLSAFGDVEFAEDIVVLGEGTYEVIGGVTTTRSDLAFFALAVSQGALINDGPVSVTQSFDWRGGTIRGAGSLVIEADAWAQFGSFFGGVLTLGQAMEVRTNAVATGNTLVYLGHYDYDAQGALTDYAGAITIAETASLTITDGVSFRAYWSGLGQSPQARIDNTGSLVKTGSGTATIDDEILLTNTGVLAVSGELVVHDSILGGTVSVAEDAVLTLAGDSLLLNELVFELDGELEVRAGWTMVEGDRDLARLRVTGGSLESQGETVVTDRLRWSGGTLRGDGTLVVAAGAEAQLGLPDFNRAMTLAQTLRIEGDVVQEAFAFLRMGDYSYDPDTGYTNYSARIDISADASFTMSGAAQIAFNWSGAGERPQANIDNAGQFRKTGEQVSNIGDDVLFANTGLLAVEAGELRLTDADLAGEVSVAEGAVLTFLGDVVVQEDALYGLAGELSIQGGFTLVEGDLDLSNLSMLGGRFESQGETVITDWLRWWGGSIWGDAPILLAGGADVRFGHDDFGGSLILGQAMDVETDVVMTRYTTLHFGDYSYDPDTGYTNRGAELRIAADASFEMAGQATFVFHWSGSGDPPEAAVLNAGLFRKVGSEVSAIGDEVVFLNTGSLEVLEGELRLTDGDLSGDLFVAAGAVLTFVGDVVLQDDIQLDLPGEISIQGGVTVVEGDVELPALSLLGGVLDNEGETTVTDWLRWWGGALRGEGTLVVENGADAEFGREIFGTSLILGQTLRIETDVVMHNRTSLTLGEVTYDPNLGYTTHVGLLSIAASGSLELLGDASFHANWAPGETSEARIENAGLFRSAGVVSMNNGVLFANTGTLQVTDGQLSLVDALLDGSLTVAQDARLVLVGEAVLGANLALDVSGELAIEGGRTLVEGDRDLTNLQLFGGVLESDGTTHVTGRLEWLLGTLKGAEALVLESGSEALLGREDHYGGLVLSQVLRIETDAELAGSAVFTIGHYEVNESGGYVDLSGALLIAAGGSLAVTGAGAFYASMTGHGPAVQRHIQLDGLLTKNGTETVSIGFGLTFANTGVLRIDSGHMEVDAMATMSGLIEIASGASIDFEDVSFTASAMVTGQGRIGLDAGTLTFDHDWTIDEVEVNGGMLTFEAGSVIERLYVRGGEVFVSAGVTIGEIIQTGGVIHQPAGAPIAASIPASQGSAHSDSLPGPWRIGWDDLPAPLRGHFEAYQPPSGAPPEWTDHSNWLL